MGVREPAPFFGDWRRSKLGLSYCAKDVFYVGLDRDGKRMSGP